MNNITRYFIKIIYDILNIIKYKNDIIFIIISFIFHYYKKYLLGGL